LLKIVILNKKEVTSGLPPCTVQYTAFCLAIYTIEEIGKGIELLELYENKKDLSESKWRDLSKGKAHKKFLLDKNQL